MTEHHTPETGFGEVERRPHAAVIASLAESLDVSAGLADAVHVAQYATMRSRIAELLDLDAGLQAVLAAASVQQPEQYEAGERSLVPARPRPAGSNNSATTMPKDVPIGLDPKTGEPVAISYDERVHGVSIIGRSGTGKSSLLEHLVLADLARGTPGVVI